MIYDFVIMIFLSLSITNIKNIDKNVELSET
jgi:hypothetical protein